MFEKAQTYL